MHLIGIDLAWGQRAPTGLAVLDEAGRLLLVCAVRTDEEIVAALAPYVQDECLVGIDAPLVVTNATGSREAEKQLSKDFRVFEAGAHPSNLGKPEMADGPRGAKVASLLGLDLNPRSGRPRRAIEVYPHPATVVLFGLAKTLKYKDKKGRDLALLRSELLVLMDHVETIVETEESWAALREAAEGATRKSELRVVEDQVDAVVCAYVALFRQRHPERVTTYGDYETGYIVTPSLPDARAATQVYAAQQPELVEAGQQYVALVTAILDEAGINYLSVTGRTKSVQSFATKAARVVDGRLVFSDPLREITDQIGVRVITYVHSDVSAVAELLSDQVVVRDDRDMGQETASEGRFGYASRHLLIELDAARDADRAYAALRGRLAQVQVRTVLQHAWAEFEHDIRYKGDVPAEHARDLDRRFTLAAGLLELADQEFSTIRDRLRSSGVAGAGARAGVVPGSGAGLGAGVGFGGAGSFGPAGAAGTAARGADVSDDPRIDPRELAAFLAGQYDDAGWSRSDHYAWISGLLLELGITSLAELAEVLRGRDDDLNARMDYRYPPGAVRRLDDALLAAYAQSYVDLHGNDHRRAALQARLARLLG